MFATFNSAVVHSEDFDKSLLSEEEFHELVIQVHYKGLQSVLVMEIRRLKLTLGSTKFGESILGWLIPPAGSEVSIAFRWYKWAQEDLRSTE